MAVDMFLLFPQGANILGESQDSDPAFKNKAIDVLSYRWGMLNPLLCSFYDDPSLGKEHLKEDFELPQRLRDLQNLVITKRIDVASIDLIRAAQLNTIIPKATLILRKAGKEPLQYVRITLGKVIVDMVTSTTGGENELPLETVMLRYQSYEVSYTPQKPDGSGGAEHMIQGDLRKPSER